MRVREDYQAVAREGDLQEGGLLGAEVDGQRVVLAKLQGKIYALGSVCTHMRGDLAKGRIEGEMVRCPLHHSGFDLKTGEAVRPPARQAEPVYNVKVEDGQIWVSRQPRGVQ
jgi:nitrite reductase/ring-hydroxylating ferredoxin subunit